MTKQQYVKAAKQLNRQAFSEEASYSHVHARFCKAKRDEYMSLARKA